MPLQLAPTWPQWHFPTNPTVPFHLHQQISPPFRCLLTGMCRMSRCFARHWTKVVMAFPFSPRLRADTKKTQLNRWRNLHLRPKTNNDNNNNNVVLPALACWWHGAKLILYHLYEGFKRLTIATLAILTYTNSFLEEGSVSLTPLKSDLSNR